MNFLAIICLVTMPKLMCFKISIYVIWCNGLNIMTFLFRSLSIAALVLSSVQMYGPDVRVVCTEL